MTDLPDRPNLRPLELVPDAGDDNLVVLRDPSGRSPHVLSVSRPVLLVLSMLDGTHDGSAIRAAFARYFGQELPVDDYERLVARLDESHYLESPRFAAHMAAIAERYRASDVRPMVAADALSGDAAVFLDGLLNFDDQPSTTATVSAATVCVPIGDAAADGGRLLGLVAPHLDYPRGQPCYARAYRDLAARTDATRFVILGTNHFGRSRGVVGTRKDFQTPFGPVRHDGAFMTRLDEALGLDLCADELDHEREHSIELQVHLLRHVLGDRDIQIAAYLCPDPCGPTGTRPATGVGPDLAEFAITLGRLIADDDVATCLIAGADLSHVGAYFQDDTGMDTESLRAIAEHDRAALHHLTRTGPEAFRTYVASRGNPTNICSVGCMFALATALNSRARPVLLHYHQAVTPEINNCVTCSAMGFVQI